MIERLYYRVFNLIVKYFIHCELQTIYFVPVLVYVSCTVITEMIAYIYYKTLAFT